ncbi:P-loop containing nucleoside triphosphate hydrolase protein [Aspergillus pseudoustus]|uniref:DNA repair protein RAD51 homolog 3 n=1 Tax=Aspergillus pseudoustus TaxID=1810923 RepID=A0ABR4K5D9_9EURO
MNTQEFLSPATQRTRPVVSFPASQSLQAPAALRAGAVSTGLPRLDDAICPLPLEEQGDIPQGIPQGHVTEVFGPPGVGKTSLALNVLSNALGAGRKAVWIDTGSPLPRPRLREILQKSVQQSGSSQPPGELVQHLTYFRAQSLPHLLALLFRTPAGFPHDDCDLLVIDSASGPFPSYFPNATELKTRLAHSKALDKNQVQWLMNRSSNVASDLANQLTKLATTHHIAILVINQTRTRIKGQARATLCPVLAGGPWERCISTRIVLYRDFSTVDDDASCRVWFAEVMKRAGKLLAFRLDENIVAFKIESNGLSPVDNHASSPIAHGPSEELRELPIHRKRKVEEIADSQDEGDSDYDYGWADGDSAGLDAN